MHLMHQIDLRRHELSSAHTKRAACAVQAALIWPEAANANQASAAFS